MPRFILIGALVLQACGGEVFVAEVEPCPPERAAQALADSTSLRALFSKHSDAPSLCADSAQLTEWRLRVSERMFSETEIWGVAGDRAHPEVRWRRLEMDSTFQFRVADSGVLSVSSEEQSAIRRALTVSEWADTTVRAPVCFDCAGWVGERRDRARVLWSRLSWHRFTPQEQQRLVDVLSRTHRGGVQPAAG